MYRLRRAKHTANRCAHTGETMVKNSLSELALIAAKPTEAQFRVGSWQRRFA